MNFIFAKLLGARVRPIRTERRAATRPGKLVWTSRVRGTPIYASGGFTRSHYLTWHFDPASGRLLSRLFPERS
ncbi:hypothetical protein M2281_005589 [Mesorhizobium soli]|nr:hypothetical protein [Mesorhizobium soli]